MKKPILRIILAMGLMLTFSSAPIESAHAATSNWVQQTGSGTRSWQQVATSRDGVHLAAVENGTGVGAIWTSDDSGVTWFEKTGAGRRSWEGTTAHASPTRSPAYIQR